MPTVQSGAGTSSTSPTVQLHELVRVTPNFDSYILHWREPDGLMTHYRNSTELKTIRKINSSNNTKII